MLDGVKVDIVAAYPLPDGTVLQAIRINGYVLWTHLKIEYMSFVYDTKLPPRDGEFAPDGWDGGSVKLAMPEFKTLATKSMTVKDFEEFQYKLDIPKIVAALHLKDKLETETLLLEKLS